MTKANRPKLFLATDHAGFEHKNVLVDYLSDNDGFGYEVVDLGAFSYNPTDDYPDFISQAARGVSDNPETNRAVIFGGSGQGEAIVANKFNGVRATVYYGYDRSIIELARQHNNTNVLSIGARFVDAGEMFKVVESWLSTKYNKESRHERRLELISKLEKRRFWGRFMDMIRPNNTIN